MSWVEDGTRSLGAGDLGWADVEESLDAAVEGYTRNRWQDQPGHVIVVSEKDAITSVLAPVLNRWRVAFGIARGYASEPFAADVARRILRAQKPTVLLNLGDRDDSGEDIWRDLQVRARGFGARFEAERLAVTPEQIVSMGLPTRLPKRTDPRWRPGSAPPVEVDAIRAPTLRQMLSDRIEAEVDMDAWEASEAQEAADIEVLRRLIG